ncbi:MAG TPA: hypothetical protein PLP70_00775 [bacterium]|jgi:uncharacterized BrkB/YihY/UPF0761 family membrane protein|nr:MAG: hypothetical protein BWX53_00246 [Parcubacteria group bacterium ADurb.Bin016]HPX64521.1 hypothetical protein [bacterium]HQB26373.1 hypothetical protein [bacterium]
MTKKIFATSVWTIIIVGQLLFGGHTVKAYSTSSVMNNLESVARGSYDVNTNENTLLDNIATIIQVVLGLLGTIFVILMIYAGILWMTAGGNDTQVKKAQNIIQRAAIGLLIVVLAYAITYFIFQNLPNGGESGGQGSA